ncbi:ABC transporter permease [Dyadobacter jiangsuensis]|uniref:Putative ABC transport system permease protein n=1 Tax=Dyadobacter jiangsuensis TaxID=1591085 RepID=A0A2P8GIQ8_9BACT|nr:ABC transporter permease [Dyadobacter jiangsuensis]PSL33841.1 putative ABC transport system permease protein [Dyadobacter jiangsuensis]
MFSHYLKIAFRHIQRHYVISFVNIGGLAIGLTATLLVAAYVANEYSHDRFHAKGDRIVKVEFNHNEGDKSYSIPWLSYGFGQAMKDQCAEVEQFGRISDQSFYSRLVQSDSKHKYYETGFVAADNNFLQMFSFEFVKGDKKTALTRPNTVLLTESMAAKYFGDQDPIGETITYDKTQVFEVVGVLKDLPYNSTIKFDFLSDLISFRTRDIQERVGNTADSTVKDQNSYVGAMGKYHTYLLLRPDASQEAVARKIPSLLSSSSKIKDGKDSYDIFPLFDMYFERDNKPAKQKAMVFSFIGLLILSLALCNYVNLTTASSSSRAGEVSVRKVVGGQRMALIWQFYLESAIYVTIAFALAVGLFWGLKDYLYRSLELPVDASFLKNPWFLFSLAGFYVASILLSGGYPAVLLSRLAPGQIFRGAYGTMGGAARARRVFTVFQFTVSIALIIGSILITRQMELFQYKNLGINRDRIVTVFLDHEDGLSKHYREIRQSVENIAGVESVTSSTLLMYYPLGNRWELKKLNSDKTVYVNYFSVDQQFVETMQVKWVAGPRAKLGEGKGTSVVLNETAAKELGIDIANYNRTLNVGASTHRDLVGIVKDFHFSTLTEKIGPMGLEIGSDSSFNDYLYIKLAKNADAKSTLASVGKIYNQFNTNRPFEYAFLDDTYNKMYKNEQKTGRIVYWFTGVAIVIACLGLFGLTIFAAEQRRKEIGIRKVLGATVLNIVTMLSTDFLKLVLISVLLASPLAYLAMQRWLEDFAYHIPISWWVFVLAGAAGLCVAVLTISFQGFKAAAANPVKSLKTN